MTIIKAADNKDLSSIASVTRMSARDGMTAEGGAASASFASPPPLRPLLGPLSRAPVSPWTLHVVIAQSRRRILSTPGTDLMQLEYSTINKE